MMSGSTQKATKNPLTLRQRQDRLPGTSISVRFLLARRRGGLGSIATQNAEQSCSTGSNDARSLILVRVPVWIGMLLVYDTIIVLSLPFWYGEATKNHEGTDRSLSSDSKFKEGKSGGRRLSFVQVYAARAKLKWFLSCCITSFYHSREIITVDYIHPSSLSWFQRHKKTIKVHT